MDGSWFQAKFRVKGRRYHLESPALSLAAALCLASGSSFAKPGEDAARSIGDQRFVVGTSQGSGVLLVMADRPLDQRAADVTRLLITIHGLSRNVKGYYKAAAKIVRDGGAATQGTMVVAPDFLIQEDIEAYKLPSETLFWTSKGWKQAQPAVGPVPVSSYAVLDALIAHFADRNLYPALRDIVITGHSGGGQVVQRYAATSRLEDQLRRVGIGLRYVVANPSSYVYFSDERPGADGHFGPVDARACRHFARWHYGLHDVPAYVVNRSAGDLARTFVSRNVTYLLGMDDTDPNDPELDKKCGAEMEGPNRLMRGLYFFGYLRAHFGPALRHRLVQVPGAGHNERKMYMSPCSQAVLFDQPIPQSCPHS